MREKLTDNGVEALAEMINKTEQDSKKDALEFVEEKFERRLSEETGKLDRRITEVSYNLTSGFKKEIARVEERIDRRFESIEKRLNIFDARFNWVISLILTSWLTTTTGILLILSKLPKV